MKATEPPCLHIHGVVLSPHGFPRPERRLHTYRNFHSSVAACATCYTPPAAVAVYKTFRPGPRVPGIPLISHEQPFPRFAHTFSSCSLFSDVRVPLLCSWAVSYVKTLILDLSFLGLTCFRRIQSPLFKGALGSIGLAT